MDVPQHLEDVLRGSGRLPLRYLSREGMLEDAQQDKLPGYTYEAFFDRQTSLLMSDVTQEACMSDIMKSMLRNKVYAQVADQNAYFGPFLPASGRILDYASM